ncbi:Pre-rRNA-processing ipi1 [Lecanosticta acicola]|uniref:Pre-rRNA-processing protein n=1 Tax=Lecanosticta acicola TaxID=111012 RepID=A0AAI8YXI0_9PEZI|nr:Pre-rRNA-processing ipi1 [Lecanosticta acicola]
MGSSAKKKKEKKQDFQKPKLKVGKARPKNTNATDTSFTAKSIVLKQQNLSETGRDAAALFSHNLSLLSSKNETQRRDALAWLITAVAANPNNLPQPASVVLSKAQPLILDGSSSVRQQLLKLLKVLPKAETGSLEQTLLYTRAGLTHVSADIRTTALDVLDWLLETSGEAVVSIAGGWVKTLQTFQNLLAWQGAPVTAPSAGGEKWSATKTTSKLGSNKLLVHQLTSLAHFLNVGLYQAPPDSREEARRSAALFPLCQTNAHSIPSKSNALGYLNLFGAPRDVDSEVYDDVEERINVFTELNLHYAFAHGVREVRREGGEVGRAAAMVDKALKLVDEVR